MTYVVPTGVTIESGELVAIGGSDDDKIVGIALGKGTADMEIEVSHEGVFEVPKAGVAITQGQKLYFLNKTVTTAADDGGSPATPYPVAGYAWSSAASGAATVELKLLG